LSYILEALRKSQQERDLGQVPTLETLPDASGGAAAGFNYWGAAAVALAGLAVVIALYAALRGAPDLQSGPAEPSPPLAWGLSGAPEETTQPSEPEAPAAAATGGGLAEDGPVDDAGSPGPVPEEAGPQLADEPAAPSPRREASSAAPSEDDKVPEDLRLEIEAFKREIRGQPEPAPEEVAAKDVPPQELRLPRDVEERLPAFLMTVHIYDEDPAKRFVLIDGRKHREGDLTRQDVQVEEILPDGVVLGFEGHRFFRHR
jgi:general secretion pathway protein B